MASLLFSAAEEQGKTLKPRGKTHAKSLPGEDQANNTKSKRRRQVFGDSDSDSDTFVNGAWPRWIVVDSVDPEKPLSKLSPFAIKKGFQGVSTTITNIKEIKGGDSFLVECPSEQASTALLRRNGSIFVDRKVEVTPHKTLNFSKGILYCPRLINDTEEQVLKGLRSQGVTHVKRFMKGKGDTKEPTHTFLLTFALPSLPKAVDVGFLRTREIKEYIPSPMRCFQCQRF